MYPAAAELVAVRLRTTPATPEPGTPAWPRTERSSTRPAGIVVPPTPMRLSRIRAGASGWTWLGKPAIGLGTTLFDGLEAAPAPFGLEAVTVNV